MSSCEYCEVFINTYFEKHLRTSLIWKHFFFLITINSSCLKPIYRKNAQFLWCARKWFPWFLRWLRTIVKHFWSHRENRFQLYFWHEWGRLSIILAHLKLLQWMLTSSGGFTMWFRMELIIRDLYYGINNSLRVSRTFSIHVDIVTVVIKSCLSKKHKNKHEKHSTVMTLLLWVLLMSFLWSIEIQVQNLKTGT